MNAGWIRCARTSRDDMRQSLRNSPDAPRKQELLNVIDRTDDEDNPILLIGVLK